MSAVQSVERAFRVLEAVAIEELGVTDLAHRVDLPKSTVARLLNTLEQLGAVERHGPIGGYRIGKGVTRLVSGTQSAAELLARSLPHLRSLAREVGEDAGLSVPDGYQMHYVAQEDSENDVQVRDWTGTLLPMHVIPSGAVIMAAWNEERIARYLDRTLEVFTPSTVTEPELIRKRLEQVRAVGYCWMQEEFVQGISSVAAALRNGKGRVVGAIHVHGPSYRFPADRDRRAIAASVVEAADRVTKSVG